MVFVTNRTVDLHGFDQLLSKNPDTREHCYKTTDSQGSSKHTFQERIE